MIIAFLGGSSVYALQGQQGVNRFTADPQKQEELRKEFEERQAALIPIFQAKDYNAWKTLLESNDTNHPMLSVIPQDNFAKFAEMKLHMIEANKLRQELGLQRGFGGGMKGLGKGFGRGMHRLQDGTNDTTTNTNS